MTAVVVLPWPRIVFGSIIGPAVGVALLYLLGERQPRTLAVAAVAACAGTWLWNTMLNIRHATTIDGDIPFRPFPISWQDTGTAIFTFATVSGVLLATTGRHQPGRHTLKLAGIMTAAVLTLDIYTW